MEKSASRAALAKKEKRNNNNRRLGDSLGIVKRERDNGVAGEEEREGGEDRRG